MAGGAFTGQQPAWPTRRSPGEADPPLKRAGLEARRRTRLLAMVPRHRNLEQEASSGDARDALEDFCCQPPVSKSPLVASEHPHPGLAHGLVELLRSPQHGEHRNGSYVKQALSGRRRQSSRGRRVRLLRLTKTPNSDSSAMSTGEVVRPFATLRRHIAASSDVLD